MTTRTVGPASGWRWLMNAVNLGSGNPRAVLGGAALMMVVGMVPSVVQLLVQNVFGMAGAAAAVVLMLLSIAYSLVVMGPLFIGYLRLLHASETGAPTHARAIFDVFSDRELVGRVIGLLMVLVTIGLVLFGAIALAFGNDFLAHLAVVMQELESVEPGTTPTLPPMPGGLATFMAALFIVGLFFNGVYALSVSQLGLGGRGIGGALRDGLVGALRNLLPLLVLAVTASVIGLVLLLVFALVAGVLILVGSLAHPAIGMLLAAPVYLVMMVGLYVVMFGVTYFMWRDICGVELPPRADSVAA